MLTKEDVIKVANLSKLSFSDDKLESIIKDLNNIFEMIEEISKIDTSNVEPLYSPIEFSNHLRNDEVYNSLSKEDFLENTHNKDDDFVVVPKIVD